jgi:hypothetical protein
LEKNFRSLLIAWGLLDDVPRPSKRSHIRDNGTLNGNIEVEEEEEQGLWARMRPYFPVRQLTDEEWEEHKRKKDAAEEKARRAALHGVSDAALDLVESNSKEK